MFTKKITDSDDFIEMPSAAQALYFHLNQGADDDGFNNQIQIAMAKAHASADDLKILMAKNFVIRFESGVIVIKHWRMHNTLRKDRYIPTNYEEEFRQLNIKENGAYSLGCQMVAEWLPQVSIGKVSIGKDRLVSSKGDDENYEDYEYTSDDKCLKFTNSDLLKGLLISRKQFDDLAEKLSLEEINTYFPKMVDMVEKGYKFGCSHYEFIMRMVEEDRRIRGSKG